MRTRKPRAPKPPEPLESQLEQSPVATAVAEPEPEAPRDGERHTIAWYTASDGTIQWDRMRDATQEQLKELLNNPEILAKFGSASAAPGAPAQPEFFDPAWTDDLYDMLGGAEAWVAVRFKGAKPELANKIFTYTPEQKDKLRGPTSRVLNKYAAEWMIRFKDEIALGVLLVGITVAKIAALEGAIKIQALMDAKARAQQARPVFVPEQPTAEQPAEVAPLPPQVAAD